MLLAWSRKLVVIGTMCPEHLRYDAPGQPEESDNADGEDFREVFLGVVDERFRDENARIIDERVDAPEAGQSFLNDPVSLV